MKIKINYELLSPLSHIGETASTGALFQMLKTSYGKVPVVTGNAIRGILRDKGAAQLLDILKTSVPKTVFNVLFSGGNLSGASKNDVGRARAIRELFPFISVFGGGVGSMIIAGKMRVGFAYPICRETKHITLVESEKSWRDLIDEIDFTRTDDSKNDKLEKYIEDINADAAGKASTQMRYTVQYLVPGTQLRQEIDLDRTALPAEKGALIGAMHDWFKNPVIGGMSGKGFGKFRASAQFKEGDETVGYMHTDEAMSDELTLLEGAYWTYIEEFCTPEKLEILVK